MYVRPTPQNCYRCDEIGHHFNICPEHEAINLVEDILDEGKISKNGDEGYGEAD